MHTSPSTCLAFDISGRLYSGGYDGRLIAWHADYRTVRWVARHDELINGIAIAEDRIYTVSADRSVKVWCAESGEHLATPINDHLDDLNVVKVEPNTRLIAVGGEEGAVWLYDLDGNLRWMRQGGDENQPADCVDAIAFLNYQNNILVAAGDMNGYLCIYSIDGDLFYKKFIDRTIECAATDNQGRFLFLGLDDGRLARFDIVSQNITITRPHTSAIKAICPTATGHSMVVSAYDGCMTIINVETLIERKRLYIGGAGCNGWARGLAAHPSNKDVVVNTSLGATPQVWNIYLGQLLVPEGASTHGINAIASYSGKILCGGDDGILWGISGTGVKPVSEIGVMINGISISPAGDQVALACQDSQSLIVDPATGRVIDRIYGLGTPATCCTWSPSGKKLAIGYYNGASRIIDFHSPRPNQIVYQGPDTVKSLDFVGEGQLAIGGADGNLLIWDVEHTQDILVRREGLYLINSVAWSKLNRLLVTVGRDRYVRIWDETLSLTRELQAHTRSIKGVAWSPNGLFFATSSYDGRIGIHNLEGGICHFGVGHDAPGVSAVAWLNDQTLVSGGWDGTVRFWSTDGKEIRNVRIGAH